MNIGEAILVSATLLSFGAFASRAWTLRSGEKNIATLSTSLSLLTFVSVSAATLYLAYLFMASDMSYFYVWSNSSTDLSTVYKLSGLWSGAEGSFLLWIWFMALVLAIEVLLEPRRSYLSKRFHAFFQASLAGVLFLFMLIMLDMNLFAMTNPGWLFLYPDGYGLELVLQTPEMVIHPPVVFAGYAFCVAALAGGIAYFVTKDSNWVSVTLPWGRLAWIFLTLGIGIGAIWAYYVLGWGGYWAWDPVETSSLLPWIIVTAFLHTQLRQSRKGEYGIGSPALGMLSFAAVLFATFTTRAGSIWTASVHAFGQSAGDTASARLTYLLENDMTVLGIFTLMLMLSVLALCLSYMRYREIGHRPEEPEPDKWSEYIGDKNNMLITIALFLVTGAVMLLLLFKNVNVSQSANYTEFNQKMSLFFVFLMTTMSICLVWKALGKEWAFMLGAAMLVFSISFAVVAAATSDFDWLVAFSLPSYVLAVGTSGYKMVKSRVKGSVRKTLQKLGPQMVHLGVALVLVSYVVSTNMQVFPSNLSTLGDFNGTELSIGQDLVVGDYSIRLVDMRYSPESKYVGGNTIDEVREAVIDISKSGDVVRSGVVLSNLHGHDSEGNPKIFEVEVYIYKAVFEDLYINFQWLDSGTAFIQAKSVPMMNFLWAGLGLLVLGLAIRTAAWKAEPKEPEAKEKPAIGPRPTPPASTKDTDYEAQVEEELKKFKERKSRQ